MNLERLFDLPYLQLERFPQAQSLSAKHIKGHFYSYSTQKFVELVNQVSLGLWQMGLRKGDKIATITYNNRPEWNILDMGMQQIGVINVPVYPTISPKDYVYIFNESQVKYCFLGHGDLLEKVKTAQLELPNLKAIFNFDKVDNQTDANGNEVHFWETVFAQGDLKEINEIKNSIQSADLATIIYTSGTTGSPKGVMLSHDNLLTNVRDVYSILPIQAGEIGLSFLPICHIFERTVTYAYMSKGINIVYPPSIETLSESLQEFKPHFFTTVPRLLEKVYEKVVTNVRKEGGLKLKIFSWAESLTNNFEFDKEYNFFDNLKRKVADKLVFSKIRARLGGRLRGIVTGAAACPKKIAQFFSAVGIPICEGYGLTETSPAVAINHFQPFSAMLGTVGPILPSVQVKIDSSDGNYKEHEGEILVKGGNVMMGYYQQTEKTKEVFDADGWFKTGDIGTLVKNKKGVAFLKITDRKKELLKTSGGKYVAPAPLESALKADFMLEQAIIIGDNQKFVSAIIAPSFEVLQNWAKAHNIAGDKSELIKHPKVIAYFQAWIDKVNPDFGHIEQVKKFILVADIWTVESGELTPTMKLKRRVVLEKYKTQIEAIYS
jgi:long-chain acyl-CoA synthetase